MEESRIRKIDQEVLTSLKGIYTINEDGSSQLVPALWMHPKASLKLVEARQYNDVISVSLDKIVHIGMATYKSQYKLRMYSVTQEHLNQMVEQVFFSYGVNIKKVKFDKVEIPMNTLDGILYIHRCKAHIDKDFNTLTH